jgi:hypothetical protein
LFRKRAPDARRPAGHDGNAIVQLIQEASLPQRANCASMLVRTASSISIHGGHNLGEVQPLASAPLLSGGGGLPAGRMRIAPPM